MDRSRETGDDLPLWDQGEDPRRRRCHPGHHRASMTVMNIGSILALTMLTVAGVLSSHVPDKYPIEIYHMLQERTQFGYGRDNRVIGSWGTWSPWSECSRTCGTGIQSQSRECVPARRLLRRRSIIPENGTSTARPICIGTYKRYHTCNTQECPNPLEDLRAEQCSKYNNRKYKGHNYVWVPFLDAPNSCALNCRAVGERFYATLEPAVMDGTPCDGPNFRGHTPAISIERTERWLCVAGQCKSVGCDGVVGSGVTMDACGVCGGQGTGCRLYEGIFMEPLLPKGHKRVTTIPKGAMSLNIWELRFSNNFLALRDSNGSYILNGPWSYSPSGTYKAAGTTLTYQRGDKNRMESIVATGPLNKSLHLEILSQELNPGVQYKYMLPLSEVPDGRGAIAPPLLAAGTNDRGNEIPGPGSHVPRVPHAPRVPHVSHTPRAPALFPATRTSDRRSDLSPVHRDHDRERTRDVGRKEEMKHPPTTVMAGDQPKSKVNKKKKRKFTWKIVGPGPCSKECGGGVTTVVYKCFRENNYMPVNDKRCRNEEKPPNPRSSRCNEHPCAARWRGEPWSACSVTCGVGMRTRRLECIQELNSKLTMRVAAGACVQPPDLRTEEKCTKPACPSGTTPELRHMHSQHDTMGWVVSAWGPCSVTCGHGVRNRTVTCITSGGTCSLSDKPESQKACEATPCDHRSNGQYAPWLYSEWSSKCSARCGAGVVTRRVACAFGGELFCNPKEKPTTEKQCFGSETICDSAKWFTGPWTSCSVTCGMGIKRRDVLCVVRRENDLVLKPAMDCTDPKPTSEEMCSTSACAPDWYTSDWSQCSTTCGGGTQSRLVDCIYEGVSNTNCTENVRPMMERRCNGEPCRRELVVPPSRPPKKVHEPSKCIDKYPDCELVVKHGLCRVKYYKYSCCQCHD